jgi:hypothetical protein
LAEYIANIRVSASVSDAERAIERLSTRLRGLDAATTRISFPDLTKAASLERTLKTVQQIQGAVTALGSTFRSISSPGRGDIGDAFGQAAERARRFYNELTSGAATLAKTTAGLQEQTKAFRTLASNIDTADDRFLNFVQGAQAATDKQLQGTFRQFEALRRLYQDGITGQGNSISGNQLGANFFTQLRETIPQTTAALKAYQSELQRISGLVESNSLASVGLEQELLRVEREILDIEQDRLATRRAISRELTSEVQSALSQMQGRGPNPFGISDEQINDTLNQRAAALGQQVDDSKRLQQALKQLEDTSADRLNNELQARKELLSAGASEVQQLIKRTQLLKSMPAGFGVSGPRGLPSSDMLRADDRGIQQLATAEDRYNTELQQSAQRLQQVDRLEESRARRATKLQSISDYYGTSGVLPGQVGGVVPGRGPGGPQGPARAPRSSSGMGGGVNRAENIALGVGFPLLFGGGLGTVGGSLVGSFIGTGFGGQILGGAIGQIADQFAAAAADMGSALRDPITNFQKIADAGLLASKSQEYYVQKLTEVGRVTEATAIVQAEIIKKIGVGGYNDLTAAGAASDRLAKAWAELNLQLQAAVAGPLADLLNWVTALVGAANGGGRRDAGTRDFLTELAKDPKKYASYIRESQAMARNNGGTIDPNAIARLRQQYLPNGVPAPKTQLGPEAAANALKAAQEQADTIKSAYREGFQLQQQAHDLQRQGLDLQRRVADDIFNKQQQVFRTQIETDRQRRQIAIETVDLEYRRRIANEEGRVAQVLEAEAALMRTKAQGEADLEVRRRNTELDIAKQQRDTQNYVYQLNRDIDAIRRATLSLEMDAADYRLKIERQVQDQRRLDTAVSGITPADIGGTGFTNQQLSNATQAASRFTGVANMCSESVKAFYKSLGVSLPGVTAWADTVRKAGTVMKDWSKLKPGDIVATGRPGDTPHVGVYTGGNNVFHQSASRGLKAGNYPDLSYFKQGGYFVRPNSTSAQLTTAASAVRRPNIPGVPASNIAGQATALDQRDAALKREQLTLQQQLNKLGEDAANQRVLEAARGPKDLQQRREAVALAKAELAAVVPGSRVLQEQLAFEAQGLVKLQQRKEEDAQILQTTKRTGAARKELEAALAQGLAITQQQINLDREALRLTQEKQYAVERASLQSQLGVIGQGGAAGFTGGAATAYENALLQFGDPTKANEIATLTQQIDMARMASDGWHTSLQSVGSALGEVMTTGVASLVSGTQSAQQVFAQFLQGIGQALASAAQQMIATYIAIGIAKLFAGLGGAGGGGGAPSGMFGAGAPTEAFAGGGIFTGAGPFQFRASGGPVSSSRPYVVGERGPELFVPGTGGSVVPTNDLRAAMASAPGMGGGSPVLNMSFESTNIGGIEYVSRDQLEAAMAATRRAASRDGAKRGMSMTLDKLQQSPGTRNRVGLR